MLQVSSIYQKCSKERCSEAKAVWWKRDIPFGLALSQNRHGSGMFEALTNESEVLIWPPRHPDLSPAGTLWNVLDRRVWSKKELLLTSWCQIPQQTCRGPVGSRPQWVVAVASKVSINNLGAAGHVDVPDWFLQYWHPSIHYYSGDTEKKLKFGLALWEFHSPNFLFTHTWEDMRTMSDALKQ